ncbi:MAG: relaxase/mobilization nuclease domain-containing protein [Clostridiales bacterium]|nr:relaxase/mobilization nuclease domain-containing protein [Clostridiales bacterium]
MAATRLIAMHLNKGKTLAQCLRDRTDYAQKPEKTEKGNLVTAYACDPMTVDEEFLLAKRQYQHITGRQQKSNVIAYQIRQSFKPGEITPEEANKVGYELALRFTKGKHAFIVATHTDRAHIHNHIIFNSTTLDCSHKFVDFHNSGLALQKVSDIICVEHGLSIIEKKPYQERVKRTEYSKRETFRDAICETIDGILTQKPKDFEAFLRMLEQAGYEVKRGKYTAVKGPEQKRFIRFRSLGEGYSDEEIRAVLLGEKAHQVRRKSKRKTAPQRSFSLLVDINAKLQAKGPGYQQWATVYNLKQMARTMIYLREHGIESLDQLREMTDTVTTRFDALDAKLKASEKRLVEIAALKTHIINYSKTRDVYVEYRKSGYSRKFFENHREQLTLHKAAKDAFDQLGVKKLPRVKDLTAEYAQVLAEKKATYAEYRTARSEMRELQNAQRNVETFFEMEQKELEQERREEQKKTR